MLKARFIDKILEALGDEAGKIKIFEHTSMVYFYATNDNEDERNIEKTQIIDILSQLKLEEAIEKYNLSEIVIDYGLKTLEIEYKNGKVITKNLGRYGVTGLWTIVMEILEGKNGDKRK